jgi:hypothetical protein
MSSQQRGARPPPRGNVPLVIGLVTFTGVMAVTPLFLQRRHQRLTGGISLVETERGLAPAEVRRGAYLNTGSHDVGADPDWNMKSGLYKGQKPAIIDESTGLSPAGSRSLRADVK